MQREKTHLLKDSQIGLERKSNSTLYTAGCAEDEVLRKFLSRMMAKTIREEQVKKFRGFTIYIGKG